MIAHPRRGAQSASSRSPCRWPLDPQLW